MAPTSPGSVLVHDLRIRYRHHGVGYDVAFEPGEIDALLVTDAITADPEMEFYPDDLMAHGPGYLQGAFGVIREQVSGNVHIGGAMHSVCWQEGTRWHQLSPAAVLDITISYGIRGRDWETVFEPAGVWSLVYRSAKADPANAASLLLHKTNAQPVTPEHLEADGRIVRLHHEFVVSGSQTGTVCYHDKICVTRCLS